MPRAAHLPGRLTCQAVPAGATGSITCTNAITGQLGVRAQYVSLHIVAATAKVLGPCEVSVYSLGTVPA